MKLESLPSKSPALRLKPWAHIMSEEVFAERPQGICTVYGRSETTAAAAAAAE